MEINHENLAKWFDAYFAAFNKNAGPLETVPNMQKFFTDDMEFWPYNMAGVERPSSRAQLLMTMVHPGLHEELTPHGYIIDLKRNIVVVRFTLAFNDANSGKSWPGREASAHYHVVPDATMGIKIKKIEYFTEASPAPADGVNMMDIWHTYRDQALVQLANGWIKSKGE